MSRHEREVLHALHEIKDHAPDFETDLAHIRRWLVRFPAANLLDEIDRCETWWTGPKAPRSTGKVANWRSRVRNWLQKQEEIREERGQRAPVAPPAPPAAPPRPRPFTPSQATLDAVERVRHIDYGPSPFRDSSAVPTAPLPEDGEPPA